MLDDTIVAISTPPGEGGIALVRISGFQALEIAAQFIESRGGQELAELKSHTLTLSLVKDDDNQIVDEVLVGIMRAPRSYTGEDVVEINCHGGTLATRKALDLAVRAGARLAQPGEFTRRAFLNGRIDMVQAEAVIELIRARSEKALVLSAQNLQGALSKSVKEVEGQLILVNSRIEASIDFPEEVGDPPWQEIELSLVKAQAQLQALVAGGKRTRVYRDGVKVAIVGKPNVGKSSLLNVLVRQDKAIVTEIPGTTRDIIEDYINIKGIPVRIMDTAGIRATQDAIESIGVEKTRAAMGEAEIILFMADASSGLTAEDEEILKELEQSHKLIIINKDDIDHKLIDDDDIEDTFPGSRVIKVSAREETGIDELETALASIIEDELAQEERGQAL
ncbi:MAG: tRNA uridine-5-carboxymethylaminomethyl(34) synthesis GTPase MnmE, partial [Syntrophomonadaceae bacterium]|nr:tRNA uridine-5-carboxymethylaminomethyl(34) synthesis GTPase MnmE [Syntrophomonadaceae bacterium]